MGSAEKWENEELGMQPGKSFLNFGWIMRVDQVGLRLRAYDPRVVGFTSGGVGEAYELVHTLTID